MYENAHGTTARAQSRQTHAPATQISRACEVEMQFGDFERHERSANSSELAVHARALHRSKKQLLNLTLTKRSPKYVHIVSGTNDGWPGSVEGNGNM